VGFNETLNKQRLASLLEIDQLLKANMPMVKLDKVNLTKLNAAAKEIDAFYNRNNSRQLDLLTIQLADSSEVLIQKISSGKVHLGSVRALGTVVAKLSPVLNSIIQLELGKGTQPTQHLVLHSTQSS
jgi:hypothetical protein